MLGSIQSKKENGMRIKLVDLLICCFLLLLQSNVHGQLLADPASKGEFMFGSNGVLRSNGDVNYPLMLLGNTNLDFEIIDSQKQILRDAGHQIGVENMMLNQELLVRDQNMKGYQEAVSKNGKRFDNLVNKTLLPAQISELRELAFVQTVSSVPFDQIFSKTHLAKFLGLTSAEKTDFEKKAIEINKELAKKIEALKIEARKELLAELPADKRAKLGFDLE